MANLCKAFPNTFNSDVPVCPRNQCLPMMDRILYLGTSLFTLTFGNFEQVSLLIWTPVYSVLMPLIKWGRKLSGYLVDRSENLLSLLLSCFGTPTLPWSLSCFSSHHTLIPCLTFQFSIKSIILPVLWRLTKQIQCVRAQRINCEKKLLWI